MKDEEKKVNEEIIEETEDNTTTWEEEKVEETTEDNVINVDFNKSDIGIPNLGHYNNIVDPTEDMSEEEIEDAVSPYVDLSDENDDREEQIKKTIEYISFLESYEVGFFDLYCNYGPTIVRLLDLDEDEFFKVAEHHRDSVFTPTEFIGLRIASNPTEKEKEHLNDYSTTIATSIQCLIHNNPYKPEWWVTVQKAYDEKTGKYAPMISALDMENIYIGELFLDILLRASIDSDGCSTLWEYYTKNIFPYTLATDKTMSTLEWLIDSFDRGIFDN